MTAYRPCYGCLTDGPSCPVRAEIRSKMKGLGVTSINFKCKSRIPAFSQGERVVVVWPFQDEETAYHGGGTTDVEFAATIIKERKFGRYVLRVDPGESITGEYASDNLNGKGFASASLHRLTPLLEPAKKVCTACSAVQGVTDEADECWKSGDYCPPGCLREQDSEGRADDGR